MIEKKQGINPEVNLVWQNELDQGERYWISRLCKIDDSTKPGLSSLYYALILPLNFLVAALSVPSRIVTRVKSAWVQI